MAAIEADNAQGIIYSHESESIIRKLSMKPYEAEFKTMIIWLPEKMHPSCANKLLKMIEEPPAKTLFLMVTEEEESVLPTILSRTQIIRVPGIDDTSLLEALRNKGKTILKYSPKWSTAPAATTSKPLNTPNPVKTRSIISARSKRSCATPGKPKCPSSSPGRRTRRPGPRTAKGVLPLCPSAGQGILYDEPRKSSLLYLTRNEKEFGIKFARFINEKNVIPFRELFEEDTGTYP